MPYLAIVGSYALMRHVVVDRTPQDLDLIGSYDNLAEYYKNNMCKSIYPINKGKKLFGKNSHTIFEGEIAWEGSLSEELFQLIENDPDTVNLKNHLYPGLDLLYMLKMSHRYLKDSPFFLKTMRDIQAMRIAGAKIKPEHMAFFKKREKSTYDYGLPKLNQNKSSFFSGDGVNYIYDHDSIHRAIAIMEKPAYLYYQPEQNQVMTSKALFFKCSEHVQLNGVYEEAQVLNLERWLIPNNFTVDSKKGFEIALMKVCTSITSGWFREFAWENYDKVHGMYSSLEGPSIVDKFNKALAEGRILPYAAN